MLRSKVNQDVASEAEIVRLREQLAQWRKANRPRARLPEEFWREAVGLARQAGLYRIARGLPIDAKLLKRRMAERPEFVELAVELAAPQPPAAAPPERAAHTSAVVVEWESPQAGRLRVELPGEPDWVSLLRAWRVTA